MAQRVVITDDIDGSLAAQSVRYGYAGQEYEIDLSEEHVKELEQVLAPFIQHSRQVTAPPRTRRGRRAERERRSPAELRAIRQWAREQGLQVSDRGRVSADIIAQYDAAH